MQLGTIFHQRGKGFGQRDGGSNGDVLRVVFNAFELAHPGHIQHLLQLQVHLVDPQPYVRAAGHDLGIGMRGPGGQQGGQGLR